MSNNSFTEGESTGDLWEALHDRLSPVWSRSFDFEAARGEGIWLVDARGRRFLDFTSGIGVTNTGHCHPAVVEAIREQAGRIIHSQANIAISQPLLRLCGELMPLMPRGLDSFFFSNSGAEAVEGAVKLARSATKKPNVVVFTGSFHGRTAGALALTTSKTAYSAGRQVLPAHVHVVPWPYAFHMGCSPAEARDRTLEALDDLMHTMSSPEDTAAVLVEPVLGEGGYVPAPEGFLQALREFCDRHGILLVFDEVQCGFCRTGDWFACQHDGVIPDILVAAKGIASGMPLSLVASRKDLMDRWPPGSHGGTYGGNPVSCAAALATIRVMEEEALRENARERGRQLVKGLEAMRTRHPSLAEVRGRGLMTAAEFAPGGDYRKAKPLVKSLLASCFRRGLLLLSAGTRDSVIRWIPPLTVSGAEIDRGLEIFAAALEECGA